MARPVCTRSLVTPLPQIREPPHATGVGSHAMPDFGQHEARPLAAILMSHKRAALKDPPMAHPWMATTMGASDRSLQDGPDGHG